MSSLKSVLSQLHLDYTQGLALLDNLFLAGAFEPHALWNSLHMMNGRFGEAEAAPAEVFDHIYGIMKQAGAYGGEVEDFHPQSVLEHLFTSGMADAEDTLDMLVYWSQSDYGRLLHQERYDLPANERLRMHEARCIANARVLGIVDTIIPDRREYDETWVLGSIRQRLHERVEVLEKSFARGVDPGRIRILAGNWELYAEISGTYTPVTGIQGGEDYLLELADRHDIAVNPEAPFTVHAEGDESMAGRLVGKTYLNYMLNERRRLTESLMARDMIARFMQRHSVEISVSQTNSDSRQRPDTFMTVENEARRLVMQMRGVGRRLTDSRQQFHIQLISGQPSVLRQSVLAQRTIDNILVREGLNTMSVHVYGAGRHANDIQVEILQSEGAALIIERYLTATQGRKRKRSAETLMYRTRDNTATAVPELPASYH